MRFTLAALGLSSCLLIRCGPSDDGPRVDCDDDGHVCVESGGSTDRLQLRDDDVEITPRGSSLVLEGRSFTELELLQVALLAPPVVDGQPTYATSVALDGDYAFVAYATPGAPQRGALDVVDVSDSDEPALIATATFVDADVNSVAAKDGAVVLGLASEGAKFQIMSFANGQLSPGTQHAASSFAVTSIAFDGPDLLIGTGDDGGVHRFDTATSTETDFVALDDLRALALDGADVVALQGQPARLTPLDAVTLAPAAPIDLAGLDAPGAKAFVELLDGKAFVATGTTGVHAIDVAGRAVLESFTPPRAAEPGVSNALAVLGRHVFVANGNVGVTVLESEEVLAAGGGALLHDTYALGELDLGDWHSVNHVVAQSETLMVAAGSGGLRILRVRSGAISREYWLDIGSRNEVSRLTGHARYPDDPDGQDLVRRLKVTNWSDPEDSGGFAERFGQRLRGFLHPPKTGDYTFWIGSDNGSELWISTTTRAADARRVASVSGWVQTGNWNQKSSQKSSPVTMVAGESYYVEILHKEGIGWDYLRVGWLKPGETGTEPSEYVPSYALSPLSCPNWTCTAAPPDCAAALDADPSAPNGDYAVDPNQSGVETTAFCDMDALRAADGG